MSLFQSCYFFLLRDLPISLLSFIFQSNSCKMRSCISSQRVVFCFVSLVILITCSPSHSQSGNNSFTALNVVRIACLEPIGNHRFDVWTKSACEFCLKEYDMKVEAFLFMFGIMPWYTWVFVCVFIVQYLFDQKSL